jgi:hypothetical protein
VFVLNDDERCQKHTTTKREAAPRKNQLDVLVPVRTHQENLAGFVSRSVLPLKAGRRYSIW